MMQAVEVSRPMPRSSSPDLGSQLPDDDAQSQDSSRPKRKKTARACNHCQRAHVTCESSRPCQRCIKKGFQDSCRDGNRKKAKYLEDDNASVNSSYSNPTSVIVLSSNGGQEVLVPELEAPKSLLPSLPNSLPPTPPDGAPGMAPVNMVRIGDNENNGLISAALPALDSQISANDMSPYAFGSRATNLEYSILSNILRTNLDGTLNPLPGDSPTGTPESDMSLAGAYIPELKISDGFNFDTDVMAGLQQLEDYQRREAEERNRILTSDVAVRQKWNSPEEVYDLVRTPFPYTQGFHGLISYLKSRFDKRHLMHMARAMAAYRPSFIATTKRLKEVDLIFMEQSFQRTLMEFEKVITASGTPTIIWRRTGQIAAVGKEFCILTGWSADRLIMNTTFIVELMDDKSVVDYFDVFSKLAFGDSRGVSMTECTLLKPNGDKVPTACTWTVKRDVFDIPMMIIGNFLPILS